MKILVTGTAGFIGYHLANRLLAEGHEVIGLDSINNYYDVSLKIGRLESAGIPNNKIAYKELLQSQTQPGYQFVQMHLEDEASLNQLFQEHQFDIVCHLAAQAGVRYSLKNPKAYIQSNIVGFAHILEACRHNKIKHLVYASSSSVYGLNKKMPFSTQDHVDHPVSLYAASKKSNELMAHTYSHLFGLPTTGLRFFTVYGPWGRPDMAIFLFTKAILNDQPIKVFNYGNMKRDFTYVDDIVEGLKRIIESEPKTPGAWDGPEVAAAKSSAPYSVYNIGNNAPIRLLDFINAIEQATGKQAQKELLPIQLGDVEATYADVSSLMQDFGYQPKMELKEGVRRFVDWYRGYYES